MIINYNNVGVCKVDESEMLNKIRKMLDDNGVSCEVCILICCNCRL